MLLSFILCLFVFLVFLAFVAFFTSWPKKKCVKEAANRFVFEQSRTNQCDEQIELDEIFCIYSTFLRSILFSDYIRILYNRLQPSKVASVVN